MSPTQTPTLCSQVRDPRGSRERAASSLCASLGGPVLGFCYCDSHQDQKQLREEGFIWLVTDYNPPSREAKAGTQGRDLEAGTEAEVMEESCLWACYPQLTQTALFHNSEPIQGWHLLCKSRRKCTTDWPIGNWMETFFFN